MPHLNAYYITDSNLNHSLNDSFDLKINCSASYMTFQISLQMEGLSISCNYYQLHNLLVYGACRLVVQGKWLIVSQVRLFGWFNVTDLLIKGAF